MKFRAVRLVAPLLLLGAVLATPLILPQPEARRLEVLFFGAPTENGPAHDPITRYRVLKKGLGLEGINLTYLEDPAVVFDPATLDQFDAVLMYGNWEQHGTMPPEQLKALVNYVEKGRGFLPIHCASACYGASPEFVKLVGARFQSHGGEEFSVRNVASHPILKDLDSFKAWDETYVHDRHADDREILQVRDKEPWTWTRRQGEGRVFYTASGHDHRVWDLPEFHQLIRNAIYWAVGPETYQLVKQLDRPQPAQEAVSLPGYRNQREITRAQKPLPPVESIKLAQVPPGFEISLFASEPDIVNPIHVNWDHRGRAYVIETIDYPNNLQSGNLGHDRITICEDTNGDGRADKFTRFAEKLSVPTSLTFARGGVICTNGSEILFLKDTDGDDRADVRELLFSGFNMGDTHAGPSNLRYAPDGWIYATVGYSGFRGEVGGDRHEFSQAVFRFLPDGSKLEFLQNTTNNTWGLGFTEEFDVVGSTANANPSFYLTFPRADYARVRLDQPRTPRADDNPIFNPMSFDIRQVDQFDRYTSAAGHAIYTARRFPENYWNRSAFICGPTGKLVGHFDMIREGAGWKAVQSPNNLYASADAWSAPVCAEVGPDGAVWVCDWYNLIVQHNPTPSKRSAGIDARTGKGNAYVTPLRDKQHGRIFRIYPKGSPNDADPKLAPDRSDKLVAALDHPNLFWRQHAQRLIVESGSTDLTPELVRMLQTSDHAGPHALHALDQLGALDPGTLEQALGARSSATRRAAIRLADPQQLRKVLITEAGGSLDATGRELADILLGLSRGAADPAIGQSLLATARQRGDAIFSDPVLRDAWTIAARSQADTILASATNPRSDEEASPPRNLIPNPGFEIQAGGKPDSWEALRTYGGARGDSVRARVSNEGRKGGNCLLIESDQRTDSGIGITLPVQPSTRYRLSGWIRCEDIEPAEGTPGVLLNIHGGERTKGLRGTHDWTEVSVEFDSGNRREILVHCLFGGYGGATGRAWYDDISLVAIGDANTLEGILADLKSFQAEVGAPKAIERRFKPDPEVHDRGAKVYNLTCVACHGADGKGVEGAFPPLDGSDWLTGDPELPIKIVLHGLMGPVKVDGKDYNSAMAPLGAALDDQQVADVLTYVRQRWSNDAAPVDEGTVRKIRDSHASRASMWTARELGR